MAPEPSWRRGVFIGLGANLAEPLEQLRAALDLLARDEGIRVVQVSRAFRTPPWGPVAQPPFVNAAAELCTRRDAGDLLQHLLAVERAGGRERGAERWGPRRIDLDLLLDGTAVHDLPGCRVPHPHLHERAFVLVPLMDIAADAAVPGHGSVRECVLRLEPADRAAVLALDAALELPAGAHR
jgi:2-amino-4-hydroxy-6-hydroxymethyldihydropteridine diphosphokinase